MPRTGIVTGVSSSVAPLSFCATGGSFAGSTVIVTSAMSVPPCPSETVYVKASEPLKSGPGV